MRVLFSSDAGRFQLLFLLLPCAVSVPSPFPVPFPLERHWEQTRHMATVRTVAGTALHLACFPDVCCPRSQRVDVKVLLSTEN